MTTISQRELRNESGRVLREVENGQEFIITRRGVPTARIAPLRQTDEPLPHRPARRPAVFSTDELVSSPVPTGKILDELREER
ncbi:type II toxin-antitoxin system Phd/YefM family antitoxin [Acidipropionibacterium virtanenii]|uniref:Antitoxin n=1 Tax=Acidipropionibacterium virtanenii TaxID=2057246 RepID=A0A344UX25_9ACTN|nr:type II toxin-antitoxin system prevent-host-death family antitoxin [Acidipropionibacterium virtanenii]AXE39823.1 hypothetical protein JS278_02687 [Acidipropionibacterium virtanenii]